MSILELLEWQWRGYSRYHRSRANLLIHIVVVPLFLAGNVGLIIGLVERSWVLGLGSLLTIALSFALQGFGHSKEKVPPEPFTGFTNGVSRIILEQWVTFPRFVVSGGWLRALRQREKSE